MYTIFINNNPIYLTNILDHRKEENFIMYENADIFLNIKKLENNLIKNLYLYHKDLEYLWNKFKNTFKIIEAAGGLVMNTKQEILFIYRNGVWDLPKGKIEKHEETKRAALREVQEECGIDGLRIDRFLEKTYHIYKINDNYIFKITHWYLMYSEFNDQLTPQIEEGITKVEWISKKNLTKVLVNTFANIKLLCLNLQTS
ncbi:MAG: NUDIX domain-containing protein [Flavobacteriaceae bacterium]|nr:NUDIX domain-containing protein [Flavobacteriaceae bacterium]